MFFIRRTSQLTTGTARYGVIPSSHWNQPDWIDEDKARQGRYNLMAQNIIYGGKHLTPTETSDDAGVDGFLVLDDTRYR